MKSKLTTGVLFVIIVISACKWRLGSLEKDGSLQYSEGEWKKAMLLGDRKMLYRMSTDLSDKIDDGYIRTMSEAEEKLAVSSKSQRIRIRLSRPIYMIASEPWYLQLEFDDSGELSKHILLPD